ncbi:ArsR/SmtB family transcription factor [Nocardia sp. CA-129566]|uniref:ArsR/SmtB family transcription factor n=1 Tax=Nocardia sp. CA-129566 TaxID=3239976 RepID=UPI003D981B93
MVEDEAGLDTLFHALSHPTRRAMLRQLADGEHSVGELAEPYAMSLAGASKHIQVLERAGLVERMVRGRVHICRLDARPIRGGVEWMRFYERFWTERLDRLEEILRREDES